MPFFRLKIMISKTRNPKPKILIVENSPVMARDLRESLTRMGYVVSGVVKSRKEALQWIQSIPVNLVLIDIQLKKKTGGIQAAKDIQSRFDVPLIFIVAGSSDRLAMATSANDLEVSSCVDFCFCIRNVYRWWSKNCKILTQKRTGLRQLALARFKGNGIPARIAVRCYHLYESIIFNL